MPPAKSKPQPTRSLPSFLTSPVQHRLSSPNHRTRARLWTLNLLLQELLLGRCPTHTSINTNNNNVSSSRRSRRNRPAKRNPSHLTVILVRQRVRLCWRRSSQIKPEGRTCSQRRQKRPSIIIQWQPDPCSLCHPSGPSQLYDTQCGG